MSLTLAKPAGMDENVNWGNIPVRFRDATPAASDYPTGGYAITAALVGLRIIYGVKQIGGNAAAGQVITHWDNVNGKLKVYFPTGGATNPAGLGNPVVTIAAGATPVVSTSAQPTIAVTAGSASEVPALTDLSSLVFRLLFFGN